MSYFYQCPYGIIELPTTTINILGQFRQLTATDKEAGGQLFCHFENGICQIQSMTPPQKTAVRGRLFFSSNRSIEQQEINQHFSKKYHYIGDWHTHPEYTPRPSEQDKNKITTIFKQSDHCLNCILLVIVGKDINSNGFWVGYVSKKGFYQAHQISQPT